jgi:Lon protease-like protein
VDVLLGKIVALYEGSLSLSGAGTGLANEQERCNGVIRWKADLLDGLEKEYSAQIDRAGWLEGLYGLASQGGFPYSAREVVYEGNFADDQHDSLTLQVLKENLRAELDCQVCYALILDPLTTPCGHTFCRECVARVLDHTDLCPICRRKLGLPPTMQSEPLNKTLTRLIDHFFPDQVSARREALAQDETGLDREKNLPLFVCTLSFPTMPTFLHVFEPRYRLMIRRVVESGGGKFGMVMYNRRARAQPGAEEFMPYGTLLMIERYELLPDGRSLVIATGVSRFKVLEAGLLDGYHVGRVERVDDISLAEEERLELTETSVSVNPEPGPEGQAADIPLLESMSTQQLVDAVLEFIGRQRRAAASWLHPRIMLAYGPALPDAARLPWWLACVLPISEEEKYPILAATSVRERLKIAARWTREFEARDLYVQGLVLPFNPQR